MSTLTPASSSQQIPCKVCSDPSTGLHYGVMTCDACKGFFGRQLRSRGRQIVCPYSNNCNVKRSRKHVCAPCRFKRCLHVGMSKNAIKTGRYSLKWRQNLESERQQCAGSSPEEQAQETSTGVEAWNKTSRLVHHHRNSAGQIEHSSSSNRVTTEVSARLKPTSRVGPNGESIEEMISTTVEAYEIVPSSIRSTQEFLDQKAENYLQQYKLKERLFGKMSTVSAEEFLEIYQTTGIDKDNRFEMGDMYLNSMRRCVRRLVRFCKQIPGFQQLLIEDQFNLLRYNSSEFRFFGAYKGFNRDLETAVNPNGFTLHKEEIPKIHSLEASEIFFDVAESLRRRNQLTTKEHIIAQTIIIFFPDRAPLQDRAAVENLQSTLLTCLEYLVSKRPTPQDRLRGLSQAIDMLTTIRELSQLQDLSMSRKDPWEGMLKNAREEFLEREIESVTSEEKSYTSL